MKKKKYTEEEQLATSRIIPQMVEELEDILNQHGYVPEVLKYTAQIRIDPVENGCPIIISVRPESMRTV